MMDSMRKLSTDSFSSTINVNSQEWRNKEAREMFMLLFEEYDNTKHIMSIHRKYQELQRIICMFTADPVLEKLKWLGEDHNDDDEEEDSDVPSDEESVFDEGLDNSFSAKESVVETITKEMRRFVSKLKTTVASPPPSPTILPTTTTSSSSFLSSSCPSTTTDFTIANDYNINANKKNINIYCSDNSINNNCLGINNDNRNASKTLISTDYSLQNNQGKGMPAFSKHSTDSSLLTPCPSPRSDRTCTSPTSPFSRIRLFSNEATQETDSYFIFPSLSWPSGLSSSTTKHKPRTEFDKCLIRQNEVPAFEIPPIRVSSSPNKEIDPSMIDPSLYVSSTPSSPQNKKQRTRFQGCSSFPNIRQVFGKEKDIDEHSDCSSGSSTRSFASRLQDAFRKKSERKQTVDMSCLMDKSFESSHSNLNFDIKKGYSMLIQVKREYDEIPTRNPLDRYMKMKKILEKCSNLDLQKQ